MIEDMKWNRHTGSILEMEDKQKYQDIKLKSGADVTVDWTSKTKCKRCGERMWWAVNHKSKKMTPIVLVGLAEWDNHFIDCKYAKEFKK